MAEDKHFVVTIEGDESYEVYTQENYTRSVYSRKEAGRFDFVIGIMAEDKRKAIRKMLCSDEYFHYITVKIFGDDKCDIKDGNNE